MTNSAFSVSGAGAGSWILITTASASSSASIAFTGLTSTYVAYCVTIANMVPSNANNYLIMQTSSNNGSSYDSGASNYQWVIQSTLNTSNYITSSLGDTKIVLSDTSYTMPAAGSTTGCAGNIYIYNPSSTSTLTQVSSFLAYQETGSLNYPAVSIVNGSRLSTTGVNAIQFLMSSNNIASGLFHLYGLS